MNSSPEDNILMNQLMGIQPKMYAYLITMLPPHIDANEVLQDINIAIWQASIHRDNAVRNPNAFIWGVARNKAKDAIRRVQRDRFVVCDSDVMELLAERLNQWQEAADNVAGDPRQHFLRQCIERLRPNDRQMILRRYESGQTVRFIAKETSQSESALQQFFHRLRLRLRECIQRSSGGVL